VLCYFLAKPLERIPFLGKKRDLWLDMLISRMTDVISSLPILLLLITLLSISGTKSIYLTMVLIGLISWAPITQYMRMEMLRASQQGYVQSAKALGFRNFRILFRHALPNSLSAIMIGIAFGIASAITIDMGLSFLGIGVAEDTITWGRLLGAARFDVRSWWLSLFPGFAVFVTIATMNLIGEGLRDAMDPQTEIR
jgi:peptide/nickel transport system permease protein